MTNETQKQLVFGHGGLEDIRKDMPKLSNGTVYVCKDYTYESYIVGVVASKSLEVLTREGLKKVILDTAVEIYRDNSYMNIGRNKAKEIGWWEGDGVYWDNCPDFVSTIEIENKEIHFTHNPGPYPTDFGEEFVRRLSQKGLLDKIK